MYTMRKEDIYMHIDFLFGHGYQCYVIRDECLKTFGRVDEQTVEKN